MTVLLTKDIEFTFDGVKYQFKAGSTVKVEKSNDECPDYAIDPKTNAHFDIFKDEYAALN